MSESAAWVIVFVLFLAWISAEHGLAAQRQAAAVAYTQGVIKGAADQAAKTRPCTWQEFLGDQK